MKHLLRIATLIVATVTCFGFTEIKSNASQADEICVYTDDSGYVHIGEQVINLNENVSNAKDVSAVESKEPQTSVGTKSLDDYSDDYNGMPRGWIYADYIMSPFQKIYVCEDAKTTITFLGLNGNVERWINWRDDDIPYDGYLVVPATNAFGIDGGDWYMLDEFWDDDADTYDVFYIPGIRVHVADYQLTTTKEPTTYCDGEEAMICTICGRSYGHRKIPAAVGWRREVTQKIKAAQPGQTVTIDSGFFHSYPKDIMELIAQKENVTFQIQFIYNHQRTTVTIPSNACETICDWYGPEKMKSMYRYVID